MLNVLAILKWDPTIRGILFPAIQFLVLVGSCYVILGTNIGNRLGFLVSSAAFWGWLAVMSIVWMIYGIGPAGNAPSWKYQEEVFNPKYAQFDKVAQIPNGATTKKVGDWLILPEGNPMRGEAQSAIDSHLKDKAKEYVATAGYTTGGEQRIKVWPKLKKPNALFGTEKQKYQWYDPRDYAARGLLHGARYYVGQSQEILKKQKVVDGVKQYADDGKPVMTAVLKDGKSVVNPKGKVVTHVLIRDLGTRRLRSFRVFLFSTILTLISVIALHYRDKRVMAAMGAVKAKAA